MNRSHLVVAALSLGAAYLAFGQPDKPTREPIRTIPDRTRVPDEKPQDGKAPPLPPDVRSETLAPAQFLRYQVEISGITGENFTPTFITPMRSTLDIVEYRDTNSSAVSHRPGVMRNDVLVLSGPLPADESLWQWYKVVSDGLLDKRSASLIIKNAEGDEIQRFNFYEGWPCGYSIDPLTQTWRCEIVFDKMERA